MDHRWDETLQAEHRRRAEQGRYDRPRIEHDPDVERRDQLERARRRVNKSPWEIGAAHWDQRDLYTRNSSIVDDGYARGPSFHPEEGSYAYPRSIVPRSPRVEPPSAPTCYEREAWPWLNYYDRVQALDDEHGLWGRVKHEARVVVGKLTGAPLRGTPPLGWWRADDSIREDVCEGLAYGPGLDATDIEVEVKDAEVWLRGTVPDRGQKKLAEHVAEQVRGVLDVHNRLRVRKDDDDLAFTAPLPAY